MAISASAVYEVRTAGNDTNGGGFVTGAAGSDYSQQDAKNTVGSDISTTDAVANGTTTITSATANFGTTIVGNIIYLQGGTGALAATRRQVTARASTTSITVDASVASGTGITMNIGGAVASLGELGSASYTAAGNIIHIKSGTYLVTTTTINVSNGVFSRGSVDISIIGYGSTRNDWGTKPIIRASAISTFTLIAVGQSSSLVANLSLDGADATSSKGLNLSGGLAYRIYAEDFTNNGISSAAFATAIQCEVTSCSSQAGFSGIACIDCISHDNTAAGFGGGIQKYIRCIAYNNSGGSTDGFITTTSDSIITNCVAYNNGRDGFRPQGGAQQIFENCIAEGNAGIGFNVGTTRSTILKNCAGYNNTGGNTSVTGNNSYSIDFVTGSASFFTNAASGDFSLNSTAGGGAAARDAGYPGAFPGGLTTGYIDIGAAQSQGGAGGGGTHSFIS